MNRMEEVFSVMKKAEHKENAKCENCFKLSSVAFCQDCKYICSECVKAHKSMVIFSSHKVVSIESLRSSVSMGLSIDLPVVCKEVMCSKHKDEPLKLYCRDCHKLVCRDCTLIDHKDHSYAFVVDAAPKCKLEIKQKVESVKKLSDNLKSAVKSLNDSEKELSAHSTATTKAIDDALDKVASKLMQKRKELKQKACQVVNEVKEKIVIQEKNAQLAVGEVESLLEFMNRNLKIATDQEVLSLEKQILEQVHRVSQLYDNPGGKFPVPQIPELQVHCGGKVEQIIKDEISVKNKVLLPKSEARIHTLISKQFTEEYEHESICLLHKNEENALRLEARKMQLVFRIDRNLNSIELKGSKESISEMKLKIKDALNKAGEKDSRKAVQWVRQDPSESNKVSQATDALLHLVKDKEVHFQPISVPIDVMIADCIEADKDGLQACVSGIHVTCTLKADKSKSKAVVCVSPTMATPADWKEKCNRSITSYIAKEFVKDQIEIPKEAACEVYPILMSTQTNHDLHFKMTDDGAYAIVAGKREVVETLHGKINHIFSHKQTSDKVKLSKRDYDFFTQVMQPTLPTGITIEVSPETCSITVSGSIHDVNTLVKSIMEMKFIKVPVMVDEVVVKFIRITGRQRLETYIQRAGAKAAIHVNATVHPPTLELLCHHKFSQKLEELAEKFLKQIETITLQLPKTLTKSSVSKESDEHCKQVMKKCQVLIVSTTPDVLKICGFMDTTGEARTSIEMFIKKKCIVSQPFSIQRGMWHLLDTHMRHGWMKIETLCNSSDVTFTTPTNNDDKVIQIDLKGDKVEVQKVVQAMNQLVKTISVSVVPLKSPEIRQHFSEREDGGLKIPGIEKNAKVYIEVCTVDEDMVCGLEEDMASEVPKSKNTAHRVPKLLKECTAQVVDVDVPENEEDIELRIFGETEDQVQSAEASINRLISKQFTTEEYEHESIRLLHKNQEKALKLEARKMQLVFRIDRNCIELKGSKESISEMKLKIKDALNKAGEKDSRKAVQWVRQDPSESNKVSQATDALLHLVKDKEVHFQPISIPIDVMIADCIEDDKDGLQACVSGIHVTCTLKADKSKSKAVVCVSPTMATPADWKEKCNRSITSYIAKEFVKDQIEIPKEAACEVYPILMSTQTNHDLHFKLTDDGAYAIVAGKREVVETLHGKINHIFSHKQTSDKVKLSKRDYDFFTQVMQPTLPTGITIEVSPETCSITVSGSIHDVNTLVKSIMEMKFIKVPVMVDEVVVKFIRITGRQRLETYIQRAGAKAAIHVNATVHPPTLELLCHHKFSQKLEELAEKFLKQIETITLQLPKTLTKSSVSKESDEHCKQVMKKCQVLIVSTTPDVLKICGFMDTTGEARTSIEMFIKKKCIVSQPFSIQRGMWHLLDTHMRHGWMKIETLCNSSDVTFTTPTNNDDKVIQIDLKGDKVEVQKVVQAMNQLVKTISVSVVPLKSPEIRQHFSEREDGGLKIPGIEKNAKVYIEVCTVDEDMVCGLEEDMASEVPKSKNIAHRVPKLLKECTAQVVDVDVPENEEDIELRIFGETEDQVQSAEASINRLISKQFTTEEYEHESIRLLHKNQEKALKLEARKMQLVFRIDRNCIELKGSKESISEMKLKIKDALNKAGEKDSRKAVQWVRQDPSESNKVSQATDALLHLVKDKEVHFQPISIPIDVMIADCIEDDKDGLQACVSGIHVTCTLKADKSKSKAVVCVSPTMATPADWKEKCNRSITSYIAKEFVKNQIEIPKEAACEVYPILMSTQTNHDLHFKMTDDGAYAIVAGKREVVETLHGKINHIFSHKQTSDKVKLSKRDYDFFTQVMQPTLPTGITIEVSPETCSITVSGSIHDVNTLVKSIMEMKFIKVPVMVDEVVVKFIRITGRQRLETSIQRAGAKAAIHVNATVHPPTLELLCHHKFFQKLEELAEKFPKQIETITLQLPKTLTKSSVSKEFDGHCKQVMKKCQVLIVLTTPDVLQICGFMDTTGEARTSIEMFIKKKCIVSQCIVSQSFSIQSGMWHLLDTHMRHGWMKIETLCNSSDVKFTTPTGNDDKVIQIDLKGDKVEVQKVVQAMNQLVKTISVSVVPLKSPEIRRHFSEREDGGLKIPGIKKNAKVCIEVCTVGEDMDCGLEEDMASEVPKSKNTAHRVPKLLIECTAQVVDMKRIIIHVGDITEFGTDVIVNASNEDLKHVGGVADAILKKGGQEIQVASDSYIRSHGKLNTGDVWLSPIVGNLPCFAIVHAVGPRWHGNPSGRQQLRRVCIKSLSAAINYNSIALPAISSGVFGYPIDECANIMISAIIEFCNTQGSSTLDEINIVLYRQSDVPHFVQALHKYLPAQSIRRGSDKSKNTAHCVPKECTAQVVDVDVPENQRAVRAVKEKGKSQRGQRGRRLEEPPPDRSPQSRYRGQQGTANGDGSLDIELRIFGETEDQVQSAVTSINRLISKQFTTEEYEHESIRLLHKNEENALKLEARKLQLVFRIDRNLNSIELKGSKESISEMKLKIKDALYKAVKEDSRKAQAETVMKTVQWVRQPL